jgi:DNA-binding GntR family transcriptional regulator
MDALSFLPVERPTGGATSRRIADHLRSAILDGEITPGQRIRQEEVAERFQVSRLPVREALRMLETESLIDHQTNKGARVTRLDMHQADVIYQMRERLDPLVLAESIPNLTEGDFRTLEQIQDRIEANADVGAFVTLDREFHLLTYAGCRVEQLSSVVTRLWNATQHYRRAYVSISGPGQMWVINAEHRLLLDAIERRDTVDAERFLSGHVRRTRVELAKHPEIFDAVPS